MAPTTTGAPKARNTIYRDLFKTPRSAKEFFRSKFKFNETTLLNLLLSGKAQDRDLQINDPDIEATESQNILWEAIRILGQGGFGCVALFQKKVNGQVIDSVALKESKYSAKQAYRQDPLYVSEGLISEAIFQFQLNDMGDSHTVLLRRYKFMKQQLKTRMYMEYAPYGDLDRLRRRYRAFNKYLPELFLWQLFLSLARAADKMETGYPPWKTFDAHKGTMDDLPSNQFLLHLDIKPENILLTGDPDDPSATVAGGYYPHVKLADFGLAQLTALQMAENPKSFWNRGTHFFRPPEQTNVGAQWARPVNGQAKIQGDLTREQARSIIMTSPDSCGITFGPSHNIWTIGKTMSDCLHLENREEYNLNMPYENQEEQVFGQITADMVGVRQTDWCEPYTHELRVLITKCLAIEAGHRPTAKQLITACLQGIRETQQILNQAVADGSANRDEQAKLYFKGVEINDMAEGNCDFPCDAKVYQKLKNEALAAQEGDLRLPQRWAGMAGMEIAAARTLGLWPAGVPHFARVNGKVVLRPDYPPPGNPAVGGANNAQGGQKALAQNPNAYALAQIAKARETLARQRMNLAQNQLNVLIVALNGGVDELDDQQCKQPGGMDTVDVAVEHNARRQMLEQTQLKVDQAFELWKQANPVKVNAMMEREYQGRIDAMLAAINEHAQRPQLPTRVEARWALEGNGWDIVVATNQWLVIIDLHNQLLNKVRQLGEDEPTYEHRNSLLQQVEGNVDQALALWRQQRVLDREAEVVRKAERQKVRENQHWQDSQDSLPHPP